MKKLLNCMLAVALMSFWTSCGNGSTSSQDGSDTEPVNDEVVDSIATAKASVTQDEINPEEALSLTVENKDLKYVAESSGKSGSLTVKVTNNGSGAVKGADYIVTYDEIIEDWVDSPDGGGLEDVTKQRTAEGKDIAAGESVLIVLKSTEGCLDLKNPKIVNVK